MLLAVFVLLFLIVVDQPKNLEIRLAAGLGSLRHH